MAEPRYDESLEGQEDDVAAVDHAPLVPTEAHTVSVELLSTQQRLKTLDCAIECELRTIEEREQTLSAEFASAQPMLEHAMQRAQGITHRQLDDIRLLREPPTAIREVLEAIMTLLGERDVSWPAIRKAISTRTIPHRVLELDVKSVTPRQRSMSKKIVDQSSSGFRPDVVARCCQAAADLAAWVLAVLAFSDTVERVAPLVNDLRGLGRNASSS